MSAPGTRTRRARTRGELPLSCRPFRRRGPVRHTRSIADLRSEGCEPLVSARNKDASSGSTFSQIVEVNPHRVLHVPETVATQVLAAEPTGDHDNMIAQPFALQHP